VGPAAPEPSWPSEFFKSLLFSGYLETSYTWNFQTPRPATGNENRGRIFDLHHNEFMLNQFELAVEKPVDADHPVGFKVDVLAGQSAPVVQSVGLFSNDFDGDGVFESDGNLDLVEAFIQGLIPSTNTKIKLGKWTTPIGAEVIWRPSNDNFSRSFLFGFAIPFTHTGILVTQPILKRDAEEKDMLSVSGGLANGWDQVKDVNDAKMFLASATLSPADAFSLSGNLAFSSSEQAGGDNGNNRTLLDLYTTIYPLAEDTALKLLLNFDWGGEQGAGVGGGYASWYGFAGIVRYDLSDQWFIAGRGEFFSDSDGARTAAAFAPAANTSVDLYEMTFSVGYKPVENLLLVGELRYDKADEDVFFDGSGAAGAPDENHQTTIAFDAVFTF
jgi:hypothetical protein